MISLWLWSLFLPVTTAATPAPVIVVCDDALEPLTLSPLEEFSQKNHTIVQQIYDGLVRFDPDGKIEPALAVDWQRTNPVTMRFHLRHGVQFHDGEPFDADSVRYTIERYLDPKSGFPAQGFVSTIERANVIDPHTVDIVTKIPDGLLLNRLGGFIVMIPPEYYKTKGPQGLRAHPVGTGAFRFETWEPGRQIVLRANPKYWQAGYPKIAELRFRFIPIADQVHALQEGLVDLVTDIPGTSTLEVMKGAHTRVLKRDTYYTVGATINTSRPPLSDLKVRQALNLAIDRKELIRYDLLGNGRPAATLSMEGEIGHDPSLTPYAYNPRKARKLLDAAGVKRPLHLKTLVQLQADRTARILAKQFASIGVTLDIETGTESDLLKKFGEKDWDIGLAGIPDPMAHSSFIEGILIYSHSPYSIHRDAEFDHRFEDAVSTLDPAAHLEKNRAVDRYIYENALSLFTYQRIRTYGINKKIQFTPYVTGMPYFYAAEVIDEER